MPKFLFLPILSIFCLVSSILNAQNTEVVFKAEQLRTELSLLYNTLVNVHPSVYRFTSESEYKMLTEGMTNEIEDGLNALEFHRLVRQNIREIRCGHTTARPSVDWYQQQRTDSKLIPFEVYLLENRLFIKEAFDQDSTLLPGTEILRVNGKGSSDIISEMRTIIEVDGYSATHENYKIEQLFRTYFLFLNGRQDSYDVDYLDINGNRKSITLKAGLFGKRKSTSDQAHTLFKNSGSSFYFPDQAYKLAVLDLTNFTGKGYKKHYKKVFEAIQMQGVEHLVLDLRGNGGGYFPNGNRLLRYFLPEPFSMDFSRSKTRVKKQAHLKMPFWSRMTKVLFRLMPDKDKADPNRNYSIRYKPIRKHPFKGQLYVLIDGGTFSMGSLVAAKLKHHTTCTLIGEESGGGALGSNAVLSYNLTLPESQIRVRVPYYFLDHKIEPGQTGRGVLPHVKTQYTLEDLLAGKDKEMEWVLESIRNK